MVHKGREPVVQSVGFRVNSALFSIDRAVLHLLEEQRELALPAKTRGGEIVNTLAVQSVGSRVNAPVASGRVHVSQLAECPGSTGNSWMLL